MRKRRDIRAWDSSDNLIRVLIDHSCTQSLSLTWYTVTPVTELNLLPNLTEQSKMKAIEQWFPKIFLDLSHGLEPRFDPFKPTRCFFCFVFFFLLVCFVLFCFVLYFKQHSAVFSHLSSTLLRLNWCKNIKVESTTPLSYPTKSNIVLPRAMRVSSSTTT